MSYIVYEHINKINGKRYIGITSTSIKKRSQNGEGYKGCEKFYKAIQKYGWRNFKHRIIYKNLTKKEAEQKEIELIKEYDTQKNGYNITNGGFAPTPTEESIKKCLKTKIEYSKPIVVYLSSGAYRNYTSINEASEKLKIDKKTIKGWCDGTIPTSKLKVYYEDFIVKR